MTKFFLKIILLSVFFFVVVFSSAQAAVIQKQPNNLGLVGYWPLNEGVGTTAGDSSGNGYGGTLNGSPAWTTGKRGGALSFNGSSNVDMGSAMAGVWSGLTISAWVNPSSFASWRAVVQTRTTGDQALYLQSNHLQLYSSCNSSGTVALAVWSHVVVTVDGSNNITYYINGSSSGGCGGSAAHRTVDYLHISGINTGDSENFVGSIDDVRVYNRALSADEVAYIYNSGAVKDIAGSSPKLVPGLEAWVDAADIDQIKASSSCTGAVANGDAVGCVMDKSGQGNNFTQATSGARPIYVTNVKKGNPVFRMLGGSAQTVTTSTNFPAPVTVLYVGHQTGGYNGRVLTAINNNWLLGYWNGAKSQAYFEGWVSSVGSPTTDTSWNLYSAVIPGSGSNSKVYENGSLLFSNQGGVSGPNGLSLVGNYGENSNAEIGEVLVYNRALSDSERQGLERYLANKWGLSVADQNANTPASGIAHINSSQDSKLTSGLAAFWSFNGPDVAGSTATDLSGNGNTLYFSGGALPAIGKIGQGLSFNSTYAFASTAASLNISDNLSISAWFYPKTEIVGYAYHPVNKWSGIADANYVWYVFGTTSGCENCTGLLANAGGTWQNISPYYVAAVGDWYHVVFTYNSVAGGKMYINGALFGATGGAGVLATNADALVLGDAGNFALDEFRLYNRVLSPSEVQQLYLMGK